MASCCRACARWRRKAASKASSICAAPPLRPEADSPAEALVRHLTGANQAVGVAYGTEGGMFQAAEISTVVCGPGSIQQAHQPNEFIALEQLQACDGFLRRLLDWARA